MNCCDVFNRMHFLNLLLKNVFTIYVIQQTRDWNEELAATRELPRATLPERLLRERAMFKVIYFLLLFKMPDFSDLFFVRRLDVSDSMLDFLECFVSFFGRPICAQLPFKES